MLALQQKYPAIVKVFVIGNSIERRNIYAMKISRNVAVDENKPEVLFLGGHHAREWISVEVPFLLGKYLAENYAADANVHRLVDQGEIWVVPLVNPDGLEYSINVDRTWRKNRRDNGQGNYGVDLNRNYGYQWGVDNAGSSPNPTSEVYRGAAAFSEPETQAVRDLFLRKKFSGVISFHSASPMILYPWGYTKRPSDKEIELREIAVELSAKMLPINGRLYEYLQSGSASYVNNGDFADWTFATAGVTSFTVELPAIDELAGGFFNRQEDIDPIFRENLPAATFLIDRSILNFGPGSINKFDFSSLFGLWKFIFKK
jgi:carboxypeptidase T